MIKKVILGAGVFGIALFTIATMTFAQTATPSPTASTTITPSPTTTVPGGAPATGKAN